MLGGSRVKHHHKNFIIIIINLIFVLTTNYGCLIVLDYNCYESLCCD